MLVHCPNCDSYDRFTFKLTNKLNLKCVCGVCGHSFKVKLAKREKKIRYYEEVPTNEDNN